MAITTRRAGWRRVVAAGAAALVAAVIAGCSNGGSSPASTAASGPLYEERTTYENASYGLRFTHPAAWHEQEWNAQTGGTFGNPIVYLSTQAMHEPCTNDTTDGNLTIDCGNVIDSLDEDSFLATWQQVGVPADEQPDLHRVGERLTVGGYPAWRSVATPGDCDLGADQTINVRVETDHQETWDPTSTLDPSPGYWFQLTICSRGVDHDELIEQTRIMLDSVRIDG
jgi:hypothetical protein